MFKQHAAALHAIATHCTTVRRFEVRDNNRMFYVTLQNGGAGTSAPTQLLAQLWQEHKAPIRVPLRGKWYATLKPAINGEYTKYELILTSNDKRKQTCTHIEHYTATGGYWYTSPHEMTAAGLAALNSNLFAALRAYVYAFNQSQYYR